MEYVAESLEYCNDVNCAICVTNSVLEVGSIGSWLVISATRRLRNVSDDTISSVESLNLLLYFS